MEMSARLEIAERIAAAIDADERDSQARVWEGGDNVRVYVTRQLSRRSQDIGYIEIEEDGGLTDCLERASSHYRRLAEGAI